VNLIELPLISADCAKLKADPEKSAVAPVKSNNEVVAELPVDSETSSVSKSTAAPPA
jgi:hypothetical protein